MISFAISSTVLVVVSMRITPGAVASARSAAAAALLEMLLETRSPFAAREASDESGLLSDEQHAADLKIVPEQIDQISSDIAPDTHGIGVDQTPVASLLVGTPERLKIPLGKPKTSLVRRRPSEVQAVAFDHCVRDAGATQLSMYLCRGAGFAHARAAADEQHLRARC
jgi:hypothetical protein